MSGQCGYAHKTILAFILYIFCCKKTSIFLRLSIKKRKKTLIDEEAFFSLTQLSS